MFIDVGDVSYVEPTAQFTACCMPLRVSFHSWQAFASLHSFLRLSGSMQRSRHPKPLS